MIQREKRAALDLVPRLIGDDDRSRPTMVAMDPDATHRPGSFLVPVCVIVSGEDGRFARRDRDRSTANTCQLAPTDERLSSAGSSVTPSRARRRAGDDESSRQRNRLARPRSGASRRRRRDLVAELHAHHPSQHAPTSREAERSTRVTRARHPRASTARVTPDRSALALQVQIRRAELG